MRRMIVCLCFFTVFALVGGPVSADSKKPDQVPTTALSRTVITPYLQDEIVEGKNLVFCSSFQIAWDILSDEIIKEPLRLEGQPEMENLLNQRLTGAKDVSADCYFALAGLNRDGIIKKIKQGLKAKFNLAPQTDISLQRPDDILVYAFLLKDLKFEHKFESLGMAILFKGDDRVKAFGIEKYTFNEQQVKIAEQVALMDYRNENDFIITLKSGSPQDEIVLAKVTPEKTLLETVKSVFRRLHTTSSMDLERNDTLQIPKLDFDILREYSEIAGRKVLNTRFSGYSISKAIQSIRFKLDEEGAFLKSETAISLSKSASMPRWLVFDRPFLLCLKEKNGQYPYFVMWVDNAELLVRD